MFVYQAGMGEFLNDFTHTRPNYDLLYRILLKNVTRKEG